MKKFSIIWAGQLVSIIGTSMTRFALIVYVFQETQSPVSTVLVTVVNLIPFIIASFFAGPIIDSYSKKKIMILSDSVAGLCTMLMFFFFVSGGLPFLIVLVCQVISGSAEAFQVPAYTASIANFVDKKNYNKANSMRSFSSYASRLLAPVLAGFVYAFLGMKAIFLIDFSTFVLGIFALVIVKFPYLAMDASSKTRMSYLRSFKETFEQIKKRPGLLHLMYTFVFINLLSGMTYFGILPVFVLAKTDSELIFGWVEFFLGLGGVLGSILVFLLPVPKKKIPLLFVAVMLSYLVGDLVFAVIDTYIAWYIGATLTSICVVFIMATETNIWQNVIEKSLHGRIFALKYMINLISLPIGYLLGGVLAEYLFEPMFMRTSPFTRIFHPLVEQGYGSGMAFMFLLTSVFGILISLYGLSSKNMRNLDLINIDNTREEQ